MRLIKSFETEKLAFEFQALLQSHGIQSLYEKAGDHYNLWVIEEDLFATAASYLSQWEENPTSHPAPPETQKTAEKERVHVHWKMRPQTAPKISSFSLTHLIIALCTFLFFWTILQEEKILQKEGEIALKYELIPLQKKLLFDVPANLLSVQSFLELHDIKTEADLKKLSSQDQQEFQKLQNSPTWMGFSEIVVKRDWNLLRTLPKGTLFGKIRQGEIWRLFTPVLLHEGLLHLLFNMAWVFILGRQVEERLGKGKYILLSLILAFIGNTSQYLASGPIFLGYSGIITGMVGFIWMRQKIAPWEGYPLQRAIIGFIAVFVAIMFCLGFLSMVLQFFHVKSFMTNIANAAHIIGGLSGALLGRLSFFARSKL